MATSSEFKYLSRIRLKSAKILLDKEDWEGAGYFMGLSLECALKSCICKTLRITNYPEKNKKDKQVPDFFMTHSFLRLLLLSGLSDILDVKSSNQLAYKNWSDFTIQYPGNWMAVRYIPNYFDNKKTIQLYNYLFLDKDSIIKTIKRKRRW